jgi:FkbM family methyltransferase
MNSVYIKEINKTFYCREGSRDISVLADTFEGRYHLPRWPLPARPTIVDLGSNIGATLLHYQFLYPDCRLIGVELDAANAQIAETNAPGVLILRKAIWHEQAPVKRAGNSTWGYSAVENPEGTSGSALPVITMNELIRDNRILKIDFLKIDIEGSEELLLTKNNDWLSQVEQLKVELHGDVSYQVIDSALRARGFETAKCNIHWNALCARRFT